MSIEDKFQKNCHRSSTSPSTTKDPAGKNGLNETRVDLVETTEWKAKNALATRSEEKDDLDLFGDKIHKQKPSCGKLTRSKLNLHPPLSLPLSHSLTPSLALSLSLS